MREQEKDFQPAWNAETKAATSMPHSRGSGNWSAQVVCRTVQRKSLCKCLRAAVTNPPAKTIPAVLPLLEWLQFAVSNQGSSAPQFHTFGHTQILLSRAPAPTSPRVKTCKINAGISIVTRSGKGGTVHMDTEFIWRHCPLLSFLGKIQQSPGRQVAQISAHKDNVPQGDNTLKIGKFEEGFT